MSDMVMLDANAVLRYVLNDNEKMSLEVTGLLKRVTV